MNKVMVIKITAGPNTSRKPQKLLNLFLAKERN